MEFPHREKAGRDREVLEYIAAATEHLEETKPEQWCTAPVLNAMFSAYFKRHSKITFRWRPICPFRRSCRWMKQGCPLCLQMLWRMPFMPVNSCLRSKGELSAGRFIIRD